eukprot:CAMPEP_0202972146 /NCGR_PEP_ID=MMETSP1396-20130829/33663_1 /ASSEMBLY_ACC=CAM_ASM_000872 /TAXON_ID= /ORGANISM="Pseudokeronopsis sp., Strain Brazil" /LENGTH=61 /DNA_ID=CAMNT_0049702233 /DNA_START=111 /DNA_END=293 /DNA_ORIENTATION=-
MFKDVYGTILKGSKMWQELKAAQGKLYQWDQSSTYIHDPPFFKHTEKTPKPISDISNAYCL